MVGTGLEEALIQSKLELMTIFDMCGYIGTIIEYVG
jgi:molybdenum cofactor biosynthesis enzyme